MITRKARLFLVKYRAQNGMVSSYVYTNTEEKAKDIVKESSSKYGINISSMKKYSQSTNKLLTKDLKFDIIKLQKMKQERK